MDQIYLFDWLEIFHDEISFENTWIMWKMIKNGRYFLFQIGSHDVISINKMSMKQKKPFFKRMKNTEKKNKILWRKTNEENEQHRQNQQQWQKQYIHHKKKLFSSIRSDECSELAGESITLHFISWGILRQWCLFFRSRSHSFFIFYVNKWQFHRYFIEIVFTYNWIVSTGQWTHTVEWIQFKLWK